MYDRILKKHRPAIDEIVFWLNRSLHVSNAYRGECIRRTTLPEDQIAYYQLGKVFMFQNIASATIGKM